MPSAENVPSKDGNIRHAEQRTSLQVVHGNETICITCQLDQTRLYPSRESMQLAPQLRFIRRLATHTVY